jgi:AAA family ATP:ADP antiporter
MGFLNRIVAVEDNEVRPMVWAALCYFILFAAYFILRPIRDEASVAGGVRNLQWLFLATLLGMLLIHPLYAALVSRLPRSRFIHIIYSFVALSLIVFWFLFRDLTQAQGIWVGRVFSVWVSIFNLFVVSIFWSLMADLFRPSQARRLFGFVAVGGTLGAVVGSSTTAYLASRMNPTDLLLLSAALLTLAMVTARRLALSAPRIADRDRIGTDPGDQPVGGGLVDGIRLAFSSPYLLGIVGYMLLYTITATFLYFQQAEIVEASFTDRAARTVFFARIDVAVNSLTALIQIFFTGRIVRRLGIAISLAALPLLCFLGFTAVGLAPTLSVIALFQILRRTSNYAIARPCREMLYTVLPRTAKYKAKNFIDTFVYRLGDQVGAWSYAALGAVGLGAVAASVIAAPLAVVWLGIGLWLGKRQKALADSSESSILAPNSH